MAAQRTLRLPKRPAAYTALVVAAGGDLGRRVAVTGAWPTDPRPADIAAS